MLISINKSRVMVGLICLVTAMSLFVMSCTNPITNSKELENTNILMSARMFALHSLSKHIDSKVTIEIIRTLHSQVSRKQSEELTIRFLVENLHYIVDPSIMNGIIDDVNKLYGSNTLPFDPLSMESRNAFLEYIGERSDLGLDGFELSSIGITHRPEGFGYNDADFTHSFQLYKLLTTPNVSISEIVEHLENIKATSHTSRYMSIVEKASVDINHLISSDITIFENMSARSVLAINIIADLNDDPDDNDDSAVIKGIIALIIVAVIVLGIGACANGGGCTPKITDPSCHPAPNGGCAIHPNSTICF
jgi:hypothetical protein